jgi:hypothetical protein
MPKQLGLLDANHAASTVVGAPPSPSPQRVDFPYPVAPEAETSASESVRAKGRTRHFHTESVATKREGGTHREIHDYDYTVLPLSPDAYVPTGPCPCGSCRFHTYYWVAERNRYYDDQGRLKPIDDHQWACARCTSPLPGRRVTVYIIPEQEP